MKSVSFEEIGDVTVTFKAADILKAGTVVQISVSNMVRDCVEGAKFCGVVRDCDGEVASVQMRGFAEVSFSGELPVGMVELVGNGQGGVKTGNGVLVLVVSADYEKKTAVIFL